MKIERGQKWRYIGKGSKFYTPGKAYTVISEEDDSGLFQMTDDIGDMPHHWTMSTFDVFEPAFGPVITETITRKRIVDGEFGRIRVLPLSDGRVCVRFTTTDNAPLTALNATELRAAAATLIELADAIDEAQQ